MLPIDSDLSSDVHHSNLRNRNDKENTALARRESLKMYSPGFYHYNTASEIVGYNRHYILHYTTPHCYSCLIVHFDLFLLLL